MKKVLVSLGILLLCLGGVFAYTPSTELQEKIEIVAEKIDDIIDIRGESYRDAFLMILDNYKEKYQEDERVMYILDELIEHLTLSQNDDSDISVSWDYTGEYTIDDSEYGTKVEVTISGDTRSMSANALPNHDTGDFPNSGNPNTITAQDKNYELDLTPTYTGNESFARESGVAYNGIKFELETAERVECSSWEEYKIEAIQDMTDLGLDHQHAHVQPTGEYHYHAAGPWLTDNLEGEDIVHVWYANDGFPIYYSKNGTYSASYSLIDTVRSGSSCSYRGKSVAIDNTIPDGTYVSDWEYNGSWDLDACNGITIDGEYVYFMTDEYPYGPRCLNGEYTQSVPGGGAGWNGPPPRR